jgi:hypothetical protein
MLFDFFFDCSSWLISQRKRSVLSTINFYGDGLPKLKDLPAAIGGPGETLPE